MTRGCILITGANGLLGRTLFLRLRREGRMVVGIDRTKPQVDEADIFVADVLDLDAILDICVRHEVKKSFIAGESRDGLFPAVIPWGQFRRTSWGPRAVQRSQL